MDTNCKHQNFKILKFKHLLLIAFLFSYLPFTQGQDNNKRERFLNTELLKMCEFGDFEGVKELIAEGANINCYDNQHVTPLMYSSQNGFIDISKYLLENGANINSVSVNGITALHVAVRTHRNNIITLLLNFKAKINAQDKYGATALHYAIALSDKEAIQILLDAEADVNICDNKGNSPYLIATIFGNKDIINMISIYGAKPNKANKMGVNPLMESAKMGDYNLFTQLLTKNNISLTDNNKNTVLTYAVIGGSLNIIDTLVKTNNELFKTDKQTITDLTYAKLYNNPIIEKQIKSIKNNKSYKPVISAYTVGSGVIFNSSDLFINTFIGVKEERFQLMAELGYSFRPSRRNVLIYQGANEYHQYNQKRESVYATIYKDFSVFPSNFLAPLKLSFGASAYYTFTNNKGVTNNTSASIIWSPKAGLHYRTKHFGAAFYYQYLDFNDAISNNKFSFSIYLPLIKNKKLVSKTKIDWEPLIRR